jgi:hypothetical protein
MISERERRDALDRMIDLTSGQLSQLARTYRGRQLPLETLQEGLLNIIKATHTAAVIAAADGRQNVTPQEWGLTGAHVRAQYVYARRLIDDLVTGRQPLNGRLDARLRSYAQAPRALYEDTRRRNAMRHGRRLERNILHAVESCDDCIRQARLGFVPLGTLTPPGTRECRSNCRCTIAFADAAPVPVVAT